MSNQLERVARFERDKEQQAAQLFQQAQTIVNQQRQKLSSLEQYRIDYIKNIQQTGQSGVGAKQYTQHLSFVGKLDKACEQQTQYVSQATLAADQRKRQWLAQQQRCKAVELLIEKKRKAKEQLENRREQNMLDEYANRAFFRRFHAR
ncbi:flagellar export protein FliJ [Alteromonas antoniana]|uniref:flagellar export protein FliJ n=1 Tax=Alteromonas antoniana TaxID=2803813 RepID=UPI001C48A0D3|nr:flagellar export protein FliJ [Alteromonas antoniana]